MLFQQRVIHIGIGRLIFLKWHWKLFCVLLIHFVHVFLLVWFISFYLQYSIFCVCFFFYRSLLFIKSFFGVINNICDLSETIISLFIGKFCQLLIQLLRLDWKLIFGTAMARIYKKRFNIFPNNRLF